MDEILKHACRDTIFISPGSGSRLQSFQDCDVGPSRLMSALKRVPHLGDDCDVLLTASSLG
jgi:hypothetical protein